jgi:para-aminobenzoate synthetase component 1
MDFSVKRCRLIFKQLSAKVELQNLVQYYSSLKNPSILGAADFDSERNRYSYFCAEPVEIFEFNNSDPVEKSGKNGDWLKGGAISRSRVPVPIFEKLETVLNKYRIEKGIPGIFTGGWLGFFSYDLNRFIEELPPAKTDDINLPLIRLCFYDKVVCFDHLENCFHLFAIDFDNTGDKKIRHLENTLSIAADFIPTEVHLACRSTAGYKSNMSQSYYLDAIAKTKKHIYDGDVYQINFSQRFTADFNSDAHKLFLWQNKFNPSPYSAYIDAGDYQIVSASPELFVNIDNGTITACPIKGTRPRTGDEQTDAKNYNELINNEKEKAELDMIIDLERNDLGRICEPGTIKVDKRRDIEKFSTVFHAVSTISGKLKSGMDFADCLEAIFPGGSITGAPKISAMKIINDLEPTARGLYTGSIGWIDLAGNACLNIVIRTIIIKAGKAYIQTGGGIVADSDPQAEWNETLIKAKALLAGINAVTACSV